MDYPEIDPVGPDSLQEITSQGTIVCHGFVPLDILEQRKEAVSHIQQDELAIAPFSITSTALTVKAGEIVVADKRNQRLSEAKTAHAVSVFTSFAGIKFKVGTSQKKFNRRYAVLGFALVRADASQVSPPTSGISIRKGGSGTTINSSGKVLMPGDVFGARLPSLKEGERNLQYASENYRRAPQSHSQGGKYTATIKKITYKDIVGEFHSIAEHLIINSQRINIPEWNRTFPRGDGLSDYDREAMCLKKYNAAAFLSGVQAVLESGLVVPAIDPNANTGGSQRVEDLLQSWERNAGIISSAGDENAIYRHNWDGQTFVPISGTPELTLRKTLYQKVISRLAMKFGIASSAQEPIFENTDMTLAANVRLLIGSVGESLGQHRDKLVEFVERDLEEDPSSKKDAFGIENSKMNSVRNQIFKIYNEAAAEWVKLCGRSFDNAMRHAMGTVLNHSVPNGALHYSLT
jgi:hypothetical protein